jgi:hypothetical protein
MFLVCNKGTILLVAAPSPVEKLVHVTLALEQGSLKQQKSKYDH